MCEAKVSATEAQMVRVSINSDGACFQNTIRNHVPNAIDQHRKEGEAE